MFCKCISEEGSLACASIALKKKTIVTLGLGTTLATFYVK